MPRHIQTCRQQWPDAYGPTQREMRRQCGAGGPGGPSRTGPAPGPDAPRAGGMAQDNHCSQSGPIPPEGGASLPPPVLPIPMTQSPRAAPSWARRQAQMGDWTQFLAQVDEWDLREILLRPFDPLRHVPKRCVAPFMEVAARTATLAAGDGIQAARAAKLWALLPRMILPAVYSDDGGRASTEALPSDGTSNAA